MSKEDRFSRLTTYRAVGFPLHWQFLNGLDYHQIHWLWSYNCSAKTSVFLSVLVKFWLKKNPITPHVLVTSWVHNDSIFDAFLVAKWLHIWNICSAICSSKIFFEMSVSWLVLVQFWIFLNPYGSLWVLPCPGHVLGTFKSCHRHPATQFWCVFFNFFQKITHFFFFFR